MTGKSDIPNNFELSHYSEACNTRSPANEVRQDEVRIVLVEPEGDRNIGSVCRAMKTMGLRHLVITGSREIDTTKVKTMALHGYDLFQDAAIVPSLNEALTGSVFSAGVTRRRGKFRKYSSLLPEELAEKVSSLSGNPVSIVFGRETNGLTDEELSLCAAAVHIPSSPDFPSLNLSHAVQIITYTLYRHTAKPHQYIPVTQDRIDQLSRVITDSFDAIDFFKTNKPEKEEVGRFFRDILVRGALSQGEVNRLEKMFKKMANIKIHKNPGR